MSVEIALKNLLLGDAEITAMIGDRVYPVNLPQNGLLPAVTYRVISDMTEYNMEGPAGLARPRFQVTAWGETYDDVVALAKLVETRLSGFSGAAGGVIIPGIFKEDGRDRFEEGFESIANKYGKDIDFYIWNNK